MALDTEVERVTSFAGKGRSAHAARIVTSSARWLIAVVVVSVTSLTVYQVVLARRLSEVPGFFSIVSSRPIFIGYSIAVVVAGCLCAFVPTRHLGKVVGVMSTLATVVVLAVATLGGQGWPMIVAALTLGAAWLIGDFVLCRSPLRSASLSAAPAVAFALGYTLLGTIVLTLGLLDMIRWWTLGLPVLLGGLQACRRLLRDVRQFDLSKLTQGRLRPFALSLLAMSAGYSAVWAAAPEIQYDAAYAKVWLPQLWARTGGIRFSVFHPVLAMFGTGYLVPVPAHTLGAADAGRWIQYFVGLFLVWAIWRLVDDGGLYAPLAALAFLLTPHVIWQMSTADDDLMLCLLTLGLAAAVLRSDTLTDRPRSVALVIGMLAGGALAGKFHVAPFAVASVFGWSMLRSHEGRLRRLVWATCGTVATSAPLLLARWISTGNPVFPQLNNIFRSRFFEPVNTNFNFPYLKDGSIGSLLKTPFLIVTGPSGLMEVVPPGVFGLLVVSLIIGAVAGIYGSKESRIIAASVIVAGYAWWTQVRYLRYLLPYATVGLVLLAAVLGVRLSSARARREWPLLLAVGLFAVAIFPSTVASFWNIPERFPSDVALGMESRASYEMRAFPISALMDQINNFASPGAVVVGEAYARQGLAPGVDASPSWEFESHLALEYTEAPTTTDEVLTRWRRSGASFIAVFAGNRIMKQYSPDMLRLLNERSDLLWSGLGMELYRLVDEPGPSAQAVDCDPMLLGRPECWGGVLDARPGLTSEETVGGIRTMVMPCVGTTYELRVVTNAAGGATTLKIAGRDAGGALITYTQADVPAGTSSFIAQTAAKTVTSLEFTVEPIGGAEVSEVQISTTSESPSCAAPNGS